VVVLGSTSENSEDTQELTQGRNEAGEGSEALDSTSRVTSAGAEGELRELRNRILTLEHALKVRTDIRQPEFRKPLYLETLFRVYQKFYRRLPFYSLRAYSIP
jgi:outer membrane protein TolC